MSTSTRCSEVEGTPVLSKPTYPALWLPWLPVAGALVVHADVVGSGFFYDDFAHLYKLANGPFAQAALESHGGHWLIAFNLAIGFLQAWFGLDAPGYFLVALFVHAASVRLSYSIILRATGEPYLAAFGAALWGMCPLVRGSLGWISVHGHIFATAVILWVVYDVSRVAAGTVRSGPAMLIRSCVSLLVAAASFGVGMGVAAAFAAVVFVWNPEPERRLRLTAIFGLVMLSTLVLYAATRLLSGDGGVDSDLHVLGHLRAFPGNLMALSAYGFTGLLLGPAVMGQLAVFDTDGILRVVAGVGVIACVAIGYAWWCADPATRRWLAALTALVLLCYAPIAAARWIDGLTLTNSARYHDLSLAFLAMLLCVILSAVGGHWRGFRRGAKVLLAVTISSGLAACAIVSPRAPEQQRLEREAQLSRSRAILRDLLEKSAGRTALVVPNAPFQIGPKNLFPPNDFPGLAGVFIISYPRNTVNGARVYFRVTEAQRARLLHGQQGTRLADLLVTRRSEVLETRED